MQSSSGEEDVMSRKTADCRKFPNTTCSLTISGEESEVLPLAMDHAVKAHGHARDANLERDIRAMLKDA
jgi:hypothetical protein